MVTRPETTDRHTSNNGMNGSPSTKIDETKTFKQDLRKNSKKKRGQERQINEASSRKK